MTSSDPSLTPPRFLTTIQEELNEQLIALREEQPELAQLVDLLREEQQALALQRFMQPTYPPSYPITINPGIMNPTPDWTYRPVTYPNLFNPLPTNPTWFNDTSIMTTGFQFNYTMNSGDSGVFQVNGVDPLPEADDDEMGNWDKGDEENG